MIHALGLFAAKSYLLAGLLTCAQAPAPVVTARFENTPPTLGHDLNHEQLGQFKTSSQFSHSPKEIFLTGGITESNIATTFDINFNIFTDLYSRDECISIKDIAITISYAPLVHIASNFPENSCRYKATWLHELRHVNTDVLTLQEFVPFYQKSIEAAIKNIGIQGPIHEDQREQIQKATAANLKETMLWASTEMNKTRMQRQQLIDTRAEYTRMPKICPDEQ